MELKQRNLLEKRLREIRLLINELGKYGMGYDYYMDRLRQLDYQNKAAMQELEREEIQLRM